MGLHLRLVFGWALVAFAAASASSASASEAKIHISSPAFVSGGRIPARFTCHGANVNPPLEFQGVPASAKSLVVIVEDPDAPAGLFTHWLLWNIPPSTTEIGEKSVPADSAQGDFGKAGYGGPCPPSGNHRYIFRLLALDRRLDLKSGARRPALDKAVAGHILAQGEFMAHFAR